MAENRIPVIYILSQGHSGSTLLDLILGSHSRIESMGELKAFRSYFDRCSLREDTRCTCGAEISVCEFWTRLRERIDLERLKDIDSDVLFEEKNITLLRAILDETGKAIICDSSKTTDRLERYLRSGVFDVTIIHLVRDGRAVAYSLAVKGERLRKKKGSIGAYREWLAKMGKRPGQYSFAHQLRRWKKNNRESLRRFPSFSGYALVRYEDIVSDPERCLGPIMKMVGLSFEKTQMDFYAETHHNLSGNAMKRKGPQNIERDVRYLTEIGNIKWGLSTLYLLPELRKLGYPLGRQ